MFVRHERAHRQITAMNDPSCTPLVKATGKGRAPSLLHGGTILVLLLIVVWRLLLPALRQENFGIVSDADGGLRIQDFAGNLAFAKAFWAGRASYDLESHLRLTSEWVGRPVQLLADHALGARPAVCVTDGVGLHILDHA